MGFDICNRNIFYDRVRFFAYVLANWEMCFGKRKSIMIKLTPERAWEIWVAESIEERTTREFVAAYARAIEAEVLRMSGTTDAATIAGLESAVGHLSRLCDDQRDLLVEMEGEFGVDGHYGQLEDGEHPLIDRVRAHIAQTQYSTPRATGCPDTLQESFASVGANGETLGATVQSLRRDLEQWEQNEFSRAMGCPDTMDDMGHFAEVDMPAFLRKQTG